MQYFQFNHMSKDRHVVAGMTMKIEGPSETTLGLGHMGILSSTDPEAAKGNLVQFFDSLGVPIDQVYATEQIHEDHIEVISANQIGDPIQGLPDNFFKLGQTDGALTNQPQIMIATFYADCTPILLYDPVHHCGGVVHSGWRGTAKKIASKAVATMVAHYGSNPEDLIAVIAPSAGQCCYEVDEQVKGHFGGKEAFFEPVDQKPGHYKMNIKGINRDWLLEAGLRAECIEVSAPCTLCDDRFYSYRMEHGHTGRMMAFFMLQGL